jgi:hypothetical protein
MTKGGSDEAPAVFPLTAPFGGSAVPRQTGYEARSWRAFLAGSSG